MQPRSINIRGCLRVGAHAVHAVQRNFSKQQQAAASSSCNMGAASLHLLALRALMEVGTGLGCAVVHFGSLAACAERSAALSSEVASARACGTGGDFH